MKINKEKQFEERSKKQLYLKNEILMKGYTGENFAEFLNSRKEEGDNVDNWLFEELIIEVDEFKKQENEKLKNVCLNEDDDSKILDEFDNENIQNNLENNLKNINFENKTKQKNIDIDFNLENTDNLNIPVTNKKTKINNDIFVSFAVPKKKKSVQTQKLSIIGEECENQKLSENLEKTKKVDLEIKNIFLKEKIKNDYILQIIKENDQCEFIKRQKEDFKFLEEYLKIEFPYLFIPPLISENFEENYINIFFNKIFEKRFGQDSKILKIFINDEEFEEFKNKKITLKEEKILNRMNLLFNDENKKKEINENEMFYDSFFNTVLGDYVEKKKNLYFFKNLFEKMISNFTEEKNNYCNIKSLFSELEGFLCLSEGVLQKIISSLKTFSENQKNFFKEINFQKNKNFINIENNLIKGLENWSKSINSSKNSIKDNLTFFFDFKKKESNNFSNLLTNRVLNLNKSIEKLEEIENKKEKIFQTNDFSKWKISKEFNVNQILEICQNFEKSKKIMLVDETILENQIKRRNLFINKRLLYQYFCLYDDNAFYFEFFLREFSKDFKNFFFDKGNLWNLFDNSNSTFLSKLIEPVF